MRSAEPGWEDDKREVFGAACHREEDRRRTEELAITLARVAEPRDTSRDLQAKLESRGIHAPAPTIRRRVTAMRRAMAIANGDDFEVERTTRPVGYVIVQWRRRCLSEVL